MSSSTTPATTSRTRIVPVDAARGIAMLMVFLSHIKQHLEFSAPVVHDLLVHSTRIATPTFLLLSGFIIRHLLRTDRTGNVSITLVDRALFLLIVAHALLGLADLPEQGFVRWAFGRAMITDAVAFAMLFAIPLRNAPAALCAALGALLFLFSWIVAVLVTPDAQWARFAGSVLFQLKISDHPAIDAPLLNYMGVFLIGMALHARMESPLASGEHRAISARLAAYGMATVAIALAGVVAWHFGKYFVQDLIADPESAALVREMIDPRSKRPPSPGYLLFYGGCGLVLLAAFFRGEPARLLQPVMNRAAVIGRTSLVCFVVQDWLFFVVPKVLGLLHIQSVAFWLAWLVACVIGIYFFARAWDVGRGNRFLTVGLKALARRRRSRPTHEPATLLSQWRAPSQRRG